jgi:hypothetical protein
MCVTREERPAALQDTPAGRERQRQHRQDSTRELSDSAIRDQAEAFLVWSSKPHNDQADAIERWLAGKDFAPADAAAIRLAVKGGR